MGEEEEEMEDIPPRGGVPNVGVGKEDRMRARTTQTRIMALRRGEIILGELAGWDLDLDFTPWLRRSVSIKNLLPSLDILWDQGLRERI